MRLIELVDDNQKKDMVVPVPWLKLRADMTSKLAEVLETEDTSGHRMICMGGSAMSPHYVQVSTSAMNWP